MYILCVHNVYRTHWAPLWPTVHDVVSDRMREIKLNTNVNLNLFTITREGNKLSLGKEREQLIWARPHVKVADSCAWTT